MEADSVEEIVVAAEGVCERSLIHDMASGSGCFYGKTMYESDLLCA